MSSRSVHRLRRRPPPPGAAQSPLHSGVHAPHLARARPDRGPSGHRGRGPTTTTHPPPQHRRVPHWGPGGGQNERGKTPPPAQRTQKQTGTPAGRQIKITGWAATQRRRRGERHRQHPERGRGQKPARTTAGWANETRQRPAGPPGKAPTDPPPHRGPCWAVARKTRNQPKEPALRPLRRAQRPAPAGKNSRRKERYQAQGAGRIGRARPAQEITVSARPFFRVRPTGRRVFAAPNGGRHHFRSV